VTVVVGVYLSLMHLLGSRGSWTGSVGYIASFGILGAIVLGFGFSSLIEQYGATPMYRRGVLLSLAALFLWAPLASPPPALPSAVSWHDPPTRAFATLAEALRRTIPADARIFNLGATQTLYAAGLTPYLRQNFGFNTLSSTPDDRVRKKSGLWGEPEIRAWLSQDADYAVIVPASVDGYRDTCGSCVALVESLLAQYFEQVTVLAEYPGQTYIVYKRSRHQPRVSVEFSRAS
jgi:hypothetical protein